MIIEPAAGGLLINWLGHASGAVVFGLFLHVLWRDRSGARLPGQSKALGATALAFLWNIAGLFSFAGTRSSGLMVVGSLASTMMPALLFDLAVGRRPRWMVHFGYVLSVAAGALHFSEIVHESASIHRLGLVIIAVGFGTLSVYVMAIERRRLWPTLALLLFALSFLHFDTGEQHGVWWAELFVHHAGIPLAMIVLLQDYRSVLLDAFIRFLTTTLLAISFAVLARLWMQRAPYGGEVGVFTTLAGLTLLLVLFATARSRVQSLLTRLVFRRPRLETLLTRLRTITGDERKVLDVAGAMISDFFEASPISDADASARTIVEGLGLSVPVVTAAEPRMEGLRSAYGVEAILPIGDPERFLLLGRRAGGRRYLSEDLDAMSQAGMRVLEAVEQGRRLEMQRLVTEAELRALQAQIHPHFLFNALNTLYGVIPREAAGARRTVLNLADIFRYFLQSQRTFVSLKEELGIVAAYLEIESLRLGPKLRTEMDVDPAAMREMIPLLSVEPLVENAVKHGVARKTEGGVVRVAVSVRGGCMELSVCDTGNGFSEDAEHGEGVGLENVRRRLRLCYGPDADLRIESSAEGTKVSFAVPMGEREGVAV